MFHAPNFVKKKGLNDTIGVSFGLKWQKRSFWAKLNFYEKFKGQIEPYFFRKWRRHGLYGLSRGREEREGGLFGERLGLEILEKKKRRGN